MASGVVAPAACVSARHGRSLRACAPRRPTRRPGGARPPSQWTPECQHTAARKYSLGVRKRPITRSSAHEARAQGRSPTPEHPRGRPAGAVQRGRGTHRVPHVAACQGQRRAAMWRSSSPTASAEMAVVERCAWPSQRCTRSRGIPFARRVVDSRVVHVTMASNAMCASYLLLYALLVQATSPCVGCCRRRRAHARPCNPIRA